MVCYIAKLPSKLAKFSRKYPQWRCFLVKLQTWIWGNSFTQKGALLCLYLKSTIFLWFCKRFQGSVFTERQVTAYEYIEKTWRISIFVNSIFSLLYFLQHFSLKIFMLFLKIPCIYRNSFPEVLYDKVVLEHFTKLPGKGIRWGCSSELLSCEFCEAFPNSSCFYRFETFWQFCWLTI